MTTWYKRKVKKCALKVYKVLHLFDIKKELNTKILGTKKQYITRIISDYYSDNGFFNCYGFFVKDVKNEVYRQLKKHDSKNALLFRK